MLKWGLNGKILGHKGSRNGRVLNKFIVSIAGMDLKRKLIILFMIISVIPLTALGLLPYNHASHTVQQKVYQTILESLSQITFSINYVISDVEQLSMYIYSNSDVQQVLSVNGEERSVADKYRDEQRIKTILESLIGFKNWDIEKLHKIAAAWAEGSGTGTTGSTVPDGQNWVSWTTKPPASDSVASRQAVGTELYSWQSVDMAMLVSDWLADSSTNYGVMLDPGEISYAFSSSENGVQNWRPKLTVTYSVPVTAIDVAPKSKTIKIGEQTKLTASLQPANATNHNVLWNSADKTIATVSADGIVTGVRTGITTITAKSLDGGFEATAEISVESSGINANLSGLSLNSGTFTEAFVSSLEHYTAIVPDANNQVQVTALTEDNLSTITVSLNHGEAKPVTSGQPSNALQLEIGNNLITVQVTSPGAKVQRTYTIEVAKTAIILQEGVGGYVGTTDTQISKGTGGQGNKYYQYNFGAQHGIEVGYYNQSVMDEKYGLIRFDHLPIPEGATITSATLNLYHFGSRGSNGTIANTDKEIYVHQANAPWVEGRGGNSSSNDGAPGEPGEVTWENYITNGTNSYDPAVIDSKIVTQSPKWNTFDITGVVQNWTANPDLNNGVLLKRETFADASNSNIIGTKQFRTSEYSTVEQRPYL
jgi:hypothetical protein